MVNQLFIPNSTQVPNVTLDYLLAKLPAAELKCFFYIIRRTYGFRKKFDYISLTQFQGGIKDKKGNQFDYGTGLSRPAVVSALKNLESAGLIKSVKFGPWKSKRYMINLDVDLSLTIDKISINKRADNKYISDRLNQPQLF